MERAHCGMMSQCRLGRLGGLRYLSSTMHHMQQASAAPVQQLKRHSPCVAAAGAKRSEAASDNRRNAGSKAVSSVLDGMSSDSRRRKIFRDSQQSHADSDHRESDYRGTSGERNGSKQQQSPPTESRSVTSQPISLPASRTRYSEGDQGPQLSSKRNLHEKFGWDKSASARREGSRTKHSEHAARGDPPPHLPTYPPPHPSCSIVIIATLAP